VIKMAKPIVH